MNHDPFIYKQKVRAAVEANIKRRDMKNYAPTKTSAAKDNLPKVIPGVYRVATPTEYTKDNEVKTAWTNIGRGFTGAKGISLRLNALPLSGNLFLFPATEDNE